MELTGIGACDRVVDRVRDEAERPVVLEELRAKEPRDAGRSAERPQAVQDHEIVADESGAECRQVEQQRDAGNRDTGQRHASACQSAGRRWGGGHVERFRQAT